MDLLTVAQAANGLGVTTGRVYQLIAAGDLTVERVGRTILVSPQSVARRRRTTNAAVSRALSPRMAWAALRTNLATNRLNEITATVGLSRSERQRLVALRARDVADVAALCRRRAVTHRFRARDVYAQRLAADTAVARGGISAIEDYAVDLTAVRGTVELYAAMGDLPGLEDKYRLHRDQTGDVIVHVVTSEFAWAVERGGVMSAAAVGVDMVESDDPRVRRSGLRLLARVERGNFAGE